MESIAVLTSGDDAPGMNAALRAIAKVAAAQGIRVIGVERGFDGLIDGQFRALTRPVAGGLAPIGELQSDGNAGGTLLGTARSPRFREVSGRTAAIGQLTAIESLGLIVIGGSGSMAGCHRLAQEAPFPVVGVPASIYNDIGCTSDAIGVDTALNTIVEACDRVSDTARALRRAFVVEVMGRQSGYLTMAAAVAMAADAALLPERSRSDGELVDALSEVIRVALASERRDRRVLIIKAEGVSPPAAELVEQLGRRVAVDGIDVRAIVLGHFVRGGRPSFHDRMLAGRVGRIAVEALHAGQTDVMTAWRTTVEGGSPTIDPMVQLFELETVLRETDALVDGTSEVTRRRLRRMEEIQGVLAL